MSKSFSELRLGKVMKVVKAIKPETAPLRVLSNTCDGMYFNSHTDYLDKIKRESIRLGAPIDDLGRLCEWIVDSPPLDDEEDHWMNIRPY